LQVLSGNLRLKIAIELGFSEVPVIFQNFSENEIKFISVSTNQQREKSALDKYRELQFIKKVFSISQGSRTDLNPQLKEESEIRKQTMSGISDYEKNQFNKLEKLGKELFGENHKEKIENELKGLNRSKKSLNSVVTRLEKEHKRKVNQTVIPETFEINEDGFQVLNQSCENMSQIEDKSVSTIVTSPPYFQMREYGNGEAELGLEKDREDYINNLIKIFNECHRVLKDDGSLMVNINEKVENGSYRAVCFQFVLEMIKNGWRLNDEIIWVKNNVQYTIGKRTIRNHEYIFHFVKSGAKDFYYNEGLVERFNDPSGSYILGNGEKFPKFLSGMDFTGSKMRTNAANTMKLRNHCIEEGFNLTHSATFPVQVPGLLVLLTSRPGDLVLDPFNGTGTVGEVCKAMGRRYVGYDLNPEFIMATQIRMNNSDLQMNLIHHNFNQGIRLAG
jgi:site-specific DNA-methyltransferase (adenine-specific)